MYSIICPQKTYSNNHKKLPPTFRSSGSSYSLLSTLYSLTFPYNFRCTTLNARTCSAA